MKRWKYPFYAACDSVCIFLVSAVKYLVNVEISTRQYCLTFLVIHAYADKQVVT